MSAEVSASPIQSGARANRDIDEIIRYHLSEDAGHGHP